MNRPKLTVAALAFFLALPACGPGDIAVTIELQRPDPETGENRPTAIADVPVQLIPYDRDFIFDSLTTASGVPEPELPAALVIARDSINAARTQWLALEAQWAAGRDRLLAIREEMDGYNEAEAQYRVLFNEFNDLDIQVAAAERAKDQAFATFERLQDATFEEMETFNARLLAWEDQAFADFGTIVQARLRQLGRAEMADTTDATGRAQFRPVPAEWWVHSRYSVATEELYWNVPVTIERGTPVELQLTRNNAEIRPIY